MKNKINLIDQIPAEEQKKIRDYVVKTSQIEDNQFSGIPTFLADWNDNKQILYHLLGNSLIKEFPYRYEKTEKELAKEIRGNLFFLNDNAIKKFLNRYDIEVKRLYYDLQIIDAAEKEILIKLDSTAKIAHKVVPEGVCLTISRSRSLSKKYKDKHDLVIKPGMKIMKVLSTVIEFFDLKIDKTIIERFKIEISQIFNKRFFYGAICYSIHPLDFLTMSDNSLGWSSCMSWVTSGCYHAGTLEMMNSNNVICCYLKSENNDFNFDGIEWNNKKWRQLFYITPEIICGGTCYPYSSKELTLTILDKLREAAKVYLNWTYEYGPEEYRDMISVDRESKLEQKRIERRYSKNPSKTIIFDTKMMYNDFLNKSFEDTKDYFCVRNKVEKPIIINASGKCKCIICNKDLQSANKRNSHDWGYNERYSNTGEVICRACERKKSCFNCFETKNLIELPSKKKICVKCYLNSRGNIARCKICNNFYSGYNKTAFISEETFKKIKNIEDSCIVNQLFRLLTTYHSYTVVSPFSHNCYNASEISRTLRCRPSFDSITLKEFWEMVEKECQPMLFAPESNILGEEIVAEELFSIFTKEDILNSNIGICPRCLTKRKKVKESLNLLQTSSSFWACSRFFYTFKSDFIMGKPKKLFVKRY